MPAHTPRVTIAMVSWNTRELLRGALESIHPDVESGLAEVRLVDNDSSDGSAEMVAAQFPWVHLIASKENLGFGRGVNLAAAGSRADWIATANADIGVRRGAIETLIAAGERDPRAGAIAPQLILLDGSVQHSVNGFPTVPFSVALALGLYRRSRLLGDRWAFPGEWDSSRARRVPWAVAAFLIVRREVWEELGGFDERQFMYAEDLDLGWRLRELGRPTRYEPRARIDHHEAASTKQFFGPELEPHWQRSTYGFLVRRRGVANTWTVALINALGAALRWIKAAVGPSADAPLRRAHARWAKVHLKALRSRTELERLR